MQKRIAEPRDQFREKVKTNAKVMVTRKNQEHKECEQGLKDYSQRAKVNAKRKRFFLEISF